MSRGGEGCDVLRAASRHGEGGEGRPRAGVAPCDLIGDVCGGGT